MPKAKPAKTQPDKLMPRKALVIKEPSGTTIHPTRLPVQKLNLKIPAHLSASIASIAFDAGVTPENVIRVLIALGLVSRTAMGRLRVVED